MGKRFYIILLVILCGSLLLLGFSYSKTSGLNDGNNLYEIVNDNYRVIYSNNKLDTKENKELDISIINKSKEERSLFLKLKGDINSYLNVFYTIDDGEKQKLDNGIISLGNLKEFGLEGDFIKHTIKIYSDKEWEYSLDIVDSIEESLKKEILDNKNIYEENNNLRYYGENVDNYIIYNNNIYRIIGLINNKIRIVSNPVSAVNYNSSIGKHLSKEDYLATFNKLDNVTENNTELYRSWLNSSNAFWLSEETLNGAYYVSEGKIRLGAKDEYFYMRNVIDIDNDVKVIGGNGSLNNPYEVSYGS